MALIDELGDYTLPLQFQSFRSMMIFSIAGFMAGKQMGCYLLERGHRRVAYFSYLHDKFWSRERLRGIQETFIRAGCPDPVAVFTLDELDPEKSGELQKNSLGVKLLNLLSKRYDPVMWYLSPTLSAALDTAEMCLHQFEELSSLFTRAQRDSTISAGIGANDFTTLTGAQYLKAVANTTDKRSLTLISFDDSPLAIMNSLTSYNFAPAHLMQKALTYILEPKRAFFWNKTRIECEGIIMERETVG